MASRSVALSLAIAALGAACGPVSDLAPAADRSAGPADVSFMAPDAVVDAVDVPDEGATPEPAEAADPAAAAEVADASTDAVAEVPAPVGVAEPGEWASVERYHVGNPGLVDEKFTDRTAHTDPGTVAAFGTDRPPPEEFLLHLAQGWDSGDGAVVLLVHGVGSCANQSFMAPDATSHRSLVRTLTAAGMRVFAITFPHPFGDNLNQAIELAEAIRIVAARTGVPRISVVAHSKGGLPAEAYVRGLAAQWREGWRGDVDRLVFLGVPLGGMDWSFRHPNANWGAELYALPMPTSWDQAVEYGSVKDLTDVSIYGGAYDGLLQAQRKWVGSCPLSMAEQDWYTTYWGGQGFVSHSKGIDAAIAQGGHWLDVLDAMRPPKDVSVAAIAGGSPLVGGVPWETSGPSDGLVFTDSALDVSAWENAGCDVLGTRVFDLANHWELLYLDDVTAYVAGLL